MSTRKPRRVATAAEEPVAPAMPPPTEEEQATSRMIVEGLREVARRLRQRNLDNAVLLAQQAAVGRGPLVDHFAELGRRFAETLRNPAPQPSLRVIQGGR